MLRPIKQAKRDILQIRCALGDRRSRTEFLTSLIFQYDEKRIFILFIDHDYDIVFTL